MHYTTATHPLLRAARSITVGAGVSYHESEDGNQPAVVVHICNPDGDHDEDTHLRLSEAVELRDLLDRAIRVAESVELDGWTREADVAR